MLTFCGQYLFEGKKKKAAGSHTGPLTLILPAKGIYTRRPLVIGLKRAGARTAPCVGRVWLSADAQRLPCASGDSCPGGRAPAGPADSGPRVLWLPCAHRHGVVPRGHHFSMGPLRHDVAEVRALCRSHSLPIPRGGASSTAEARHDPGPQGPQASRSVRGRGVACLLERPLSPKGAGGAPCSAAPPRRGRAGGPCGNSLYLKTNTGHWGPAPG